MILFQKSWNCADGSQHLEIPMGPSIVDFGKASGTRFGAHAIVS